jgi:protein-S-isoprenylcysteine O-methyltransferase Ste14
MLFYSRTGEKLRGAGGMARTGAKAIAVVCCLIGGVGLVALVAWIAALGTGLVELSAEPAGGAAWLIDIALLVIFGVQHSGMARSGFKRAWTRVVPEPLERAIYVAASGVVALALALGWQSVGGEPLWQLPVGFAVVAGAGGAAATLVVNRFDSWTLLGLRQAWGDAVPADRLVIEGAYRWVRHPQMACVLVFLWGWPVMTPTLALLSGGLTLYILVSQPLEERELIARFGDGYRAYRRRVPALVPWRAPAPPAVHDEVTP